MYSTCPLRTALFYFLNLQKNPDLTLNCTDIINKSVTVGCY